MEEEKRKAYSEVVEILKLIENEEMLSKIPFEVIQLIKNNSDSNYKPVINKNIPLEEQNLRDETYSILAWLSSKYWNENSATLLYTTETQTIDEEKGSKESKVNLNEEAAVYNDMEPQLQIRCEENFELPMIVPKKGIYNIIKNKIIQIFRTIFKTNIVVKENNL